MNASHLRAAPPIMAPIVRKTMGVVITLSESEVYWEGSLDELIHRVVIINRIE